MKKRIISIISSIAIMSTFIPTVSAVKMYSPDGRTASVMDADVAAWKAKGWSTKNYKTLHAADGRSEKVLLTDVASWEKVGWYEVPVTTVYSLDGRSKVISKDALKDWKKVGWYEMPVTTVYSVDGRTEIISKNDVSSWVKVGWYEMPVTTVYSADGKTKVIAKSDVDAWVKVGWYTKKYLKLYSPDGKTSEVLLQDVAAWKKVGWYEYPVTIVYSIDGRSKVIAKDAVEDWIKAGWYDKITDFERYTQYFYMTYSQLKQTFPNLENSGGSEGCIWYSIGSERFLGIGRFTNHDCCGAAIAPVTDIYPFLHTIAKNGIVTKSAFESYINQKVSLTVNDFVYDKSLSGELSYKHNGLSVRIICNPYGNININKSKCTFHM